MLICDHFFGLFQRGSKGLQFLLQRSDFLPCAILIREGQPTAQRLELPGQFLLPTMGTGQLLLQFPGVLLQHPQFLFNQRDLLIQLLLFL